MWMLNWGGANREVKTISKNKFIELERATIWILNQGGEKIKSEKSKDVQTKEM